MNSPAIDISVVIPVRDPDAAFVEMVRRVTAVRAHGAVVREILVVDDCSVRGEEQLRAVSALPGVRVLHLPQWAGRAGARDEGARAAVGEWLWFLDADCVPRDDALAVHVAAMTAGADVSLGLVDVRGEGFWDRYQARLLAKRAAAPADAQSIANCLLRRDACLAVGGLDRGYVGYGFEDRDLIACLQAGGWRVSVSPDALAVHLGSIDLQSVCGKFNEAGRLSAPHFAARHPQAYRRTLLFRLDARQHRLPWVLLLRLLGSCYPLLFRVASGCIAAQRVPYALTSLLVRVVVAAAYVRGCLGRTLD